MVVDEIFGKSSDEKLLVDQNEVPTLNIETKKKKANDLLIILAKQISLGKVTYIVEYL